jgi:hypothetical protein
MERSGVASSRHKGREPSGRPYLVLAPVFPPWMVYLMAGLALVAATGMAYLDIGRPVGRAEQRAALADVGPQGAGPGRVPASGAAASGTYVVLAWNDLGMHCYNRSFQYLAVLPPYNTLWAQVVRVGDPPQIVSGGITVTYAFADNTFSVGKTNFWTYEQALFGVNLPGNVGLAGKGLSGTMDVEGDHFVAQGIPLTEFRDSDYAANPSDPQPYPYQLATITVWDAQSGAKLAETTSVAPVSTEMHCDHCHSDGQREGIATGVVEKNMLVLHDQENMDEYPPGHSGALAARAPVLCAECHASNALSLPGAPGVPNLSRAMHEGHSEEVASTLAGCYQCHPGPQTQCLRDVMSQQFDLTCINCHGGMASVGSRGRSPWYDEPRCDNAGCHPGLHYAYPSDLLYRQATGHGGIYCAGCHDSPHAIAPSRESNDAIKFLALQGTNGPLHTCTVCHLSAPAGPGPHKTPIRNLYLPLIARR